MAPHPRGEWDRAVRLKQKLLNRTGSPRSNRLPSREFEMRDLIYPTLLSRTPSVPNSEYTIYLSYLFTKAKWNVRHFDWYGSGLTASSQIN